MISQEHQKSFIEKVHLSLVNRSIPNNYPSIYLSYLIDHLAYFVKIYAAVLNKGLMLANKEIYQASIADIGAGNGMLGLFAKYCGFKDVYINDIDKDFIEASRNLSDLLYVFPTDFITGDINNILTYFDEKKTPDIIVGTDMIEHIYDLNVFFDSLFSLKDIKAVVFTTASNPANFWKVKQLRKIQYNDEYKGGHPGEYLLYGGEAMKPFFEIRKEIIRKVNQIPEPELSQMAVLTRGLQKADIENEVKNYLQTGRLPQAPQDRFNTCNPLTGSWSERILPLRSYSDIFSLHEWDILFEAGFYNNETKSFKSNFLKLMNLLIPVSGLYLAPFIFISGKLKFS